VIGTVIDAGCAAWQGLCRSRCEGVSFLGHPGQCIMKECPASES
jgi:hypothetical protein